MRVATTILDDLWLRHILANGTLVYPSQGRGYRADGCMALG